MAIQLEVSTPDCSENEVFVYVFQNYHHEDVPKFIEMAHPDWVDYVVYNLSAKEETPG